MELKRRTPEEREAYLLDQVVNLQSALAAANEECERLSEENKELNRQLAVAKKIFDSCRNNDNHWGDVEVENHRLKVDLAAKDAMLAAATDKWSQCYTACTLAFDAYCLGVQINEKTPRRYKAIEAVAHLTLAVGNAKPAGWLEPTQQPH